MLKDNVLRGIHELAGSDLGTLFTYPIQPDHKWVKLIEF